MLLKKIIRSNYYIFKFENLGMPEQLVGDSAYVFGNEQIKF